MAANENPEIGYQEHQSSARLAGFLREHGFDVDHPTHGLETAFAVVVTVAATEHVVAVSVRDHGIGLDEQQQLQDEDALEQVRADFARLDADQRRPAE